MAEDAAGRRPEAATSSGAAATAAALSLPPIEEEVMLDRVVFTPAATALVRSLKATNGPLIFHLSGGCCEGSAPMCLRRNDFRPGGQDVLLGQVEGRLFYVGAAQFEYWAPYQIVIDVTEGGGDSFSLEAAEGIRFTALSRPLAEAEQSPDGGAPAEEVYKPAG
jgi:uncharacterized protein